MLYNVMIMSKKPKHSNIKRVNIMVILPGINVFIKASTPRHHLPVDKHKFSQLVTNSY